MIYLFTLLTLVCFSIALKINKKLKSVVFNTLVLSVLMLVAILVSFDVTYDTYMAGNAPLNNLLNLSLVALALPLYQQLKQIMAFWKSILLITTLASIFSMATGAGLAIWLGANKEIVASVISKSVTTPIAMAVSDNLGGIPAIAAVGVILAGLQGAILGYVILKKLGLKSSEGIGLAIGSMSHALGTVIVIEKDPKAGSYSSIALVLCGIISSILAPLVFKLIYMVA
ncbi:CidB/LrgB family autolysis modulator [Pasteurellaceae bacterium 22721_9_1]